MSAAADLERLLTMWKEGAAMRTFLSASLSLAVLAAAGPAAAATRNFTVTGFEQVRVEGPFRVKLTTGVPPSASATGSQSALDRVAIDMVGRTLVIHSDVSAWGGASNSANSGPIDIQIGTHDLSAAALTGSGSLQIDKVTALSFNASAQGSGQIGIANTDVDQLTVTLNGTASAILGGRAGTLSLTTRGTSSFDGTSLVIKDATIAAQGAATIRASVSNSATIQASGPATVTLAGNPSCTTRAGGSASIEGCRGSQ
jgi:Putative auto-transporter adhesin, head GIN domain